MRRALLFAASSVLLFSACNKVNNQDSNEELLRGGTWSRTSGKVTYRDGTTGNMTTDDYYALSPDCIKDDALEFKEGYKGNLLLGSDVCNAGDPPSTPFTWSLTKAGNGIQIYDAAEYFPPFQPDINTPPQGDINADILTLTKGYLTIRYQYIYQDTFNHMVIRDTATVTDIFRKN